MALRELTKEYLMKAVYQTPLEIVRLMAGPSLLGRARAGYLRRKRGVSSPGCGHEAEEIRGRASGV